jgi:hypothetical protein
MWNNLEAWIAIGVSACFVCIGVAMHRVFVNVLKNESPEGEKKAKHE